MTLCVFVCLSTQTCMNVPCCASPIWNPTAWTSTCGVLAWRFTTLPPGVFPSYHTEDRAKINQPCEQIQSGRKSEFHHPWCECHIFAVKSFPMKSFWFFQLVFLFPNLFETTSLLFVFAGRLNSEYRKAEQHVENMGHFNSVKGNCTQLF